MTPATIAEITKPPVTTTRYTTTYTVIGMSCGHCVAAVTEELTKIRGVLAIEIDLPTKSATVTSEKALEPDLVRQAVEEAGYQFG